MFPVIDVSLPSSEVGYIEKLAIGQLRCQAVDHPVAADHDPSFPVVLGVENGGRHYVVQTDNRQGEASTRATIRG
jgi:hypothetical protein